MAPCAILSFMKWLKKHAPSIVKGANSRNSINQPQNTIDDSKSSTLDLAFDIMKELIVGQLQNVDALDAKGNFILGAATGVASSALVLQTILLSLHLQSSCSIFISAHLPYLPSLLNQSFFILLVLLVYIIVIILVIGAYRTRNYYQVPDPRMLLDNLDNPERDSKDGMVRAMAAAYEMNEEETNKKVKWIDLSLLFLVIETGMLVLNLLYQVAC